LRPIDEIIDDWLIEYGILKRGKWGHYRCIPFTENKDLVLNLVQTLKDEGYTKEELSKGINQLKVVNACEAPEGASNRTFKSIKKTKDMTANNWRNAIKENFRGQVSVFVPKEPPKKESYEVPREVSEKPLELEPKDRIKVITLDCDETPPDLDFYAELGIDPSEDE
jgi:hypothetical protein